MNKLEDKAEIYTDEVAPMLGEELQRLTKNNKIVLENIPRDKSNEAMRFDDNKIRFDLIPTEAILEIARVYTVGAIKYEDNNWRKGMKFSRCIGSLERHWNLWKAGEEVDPETGCAHLAQVCWNAMTLLVYCLRGLGTDDRLKYKVDSNFNLVDNRLNIGLSPEQLKELRNKYNKERVK